jgi:hypothetical protein
VKNLKHFTGQKGLSVSDYEVHTVISNKKSEQTDVGVKLAELMKLLEGVDENSALAKLNETTISDNNGGRIAL